MSDRRVHAELPGWEIVRYERAGKWWLEPSAAVARLHPARSITIGEAVHLTVENKASVTFGLPGGSAFDRKVQAALKGESAK